MQISELRVGMQACTQEIATIEKNSIIAEITGDYNPIHFDSKAANDVGFSGIIAHALFCEGLVSSVIAQKLPGPGSIIISQTIDCLKPVYMGDEISAIVTINSINPERHRVKVEAICQNQNQQIVMQFSINLLKY